MTAQWKSNEPVIPTGACTGTYGSQRNVNLSVNGVENFDYTGNVVCAYLQKAGYYKLEVWGAQGAPTPARSSVYYGYGYGGYSYGKIYSESSSSLYVVVGGRGYQSSSSTINNGGYNGGGGVAYASNGGAGGGGATHISVQNCGELKNCSSYKGTYDSSKGTYDGGKILIVAGGAPAASGNCIGGGGTVYTPSGGGYNGGYNRWNCGGAYSAGAGTQTSGGAARCYSQSDISGCTGITAGSFGLGGTGSSGEAAGGGGGWFGGGGASEEPGGGGSGYIGNSLLLTDKGMYMYNDTTYSICSSSSNTLTKTTCTTSTGAHVSNRANTGNGYAKITYLGT